MGLRKFLSVLILILSMSCSAVFADNFDNAENYLIGMTVSKVKEGFYTVSLQFKNDTKKQFEAKDMGNNTYAIMLPQIKSVMEQENITFSDDKPDIDVTVSENSNFTNKKKFHTKIKFKTPEESTLQVLSYGQSDVPSAVENAVENKKADNLFVTFQEISDLLLYLSIGVILLLISFLFLQKKSDDEQTEEAYEVVKKSKNYIPITERNSAVFDSIPKNEQSQETLKDFQHRKELEDKEFSHDETDETDKIIDELVQVVISKNDLVLMPGVPELPGLETKEKKNKTTKTVLDNVKVDLFDAEDVVETGENADVPEQMSLSDRIKAKENAQVSENVVKNEREEILNNISPIGDIPETVDVQKEQQIDEPHIPDEYEKLLEAYKKTLKIAHKIKNADDLEPEVTDAFAVDENTGFSLVKFGEKISLVGNIGEKLFVIKTFIPQELNNDTLFMEFCTQTPTYCAYSVILNNFKALVKVTPTEISLIGDYGE